MSSPVVRKKSGSGQTTSSERKSQEEIIIQACFKFAEVLLQSRVRFQSDNVGQIQRERPFFNLDVETIQLVRDRLEVLKHELYQPIRIDVFWISGNHSKIDEAKQSKTLLESWHAALKKPNNTPNKVSGRHYDDWQQIGKGTDSAMLKQMYTKFAVFLRSFCIFVRVLPCHALFRAAKGARIQSLDFEMKIGQECFANCANFPTGSELISHTFPEIETPIGNFVINTEYIKNVKGLVKQLEEQQKTPVLAPAIIKDYVPQPQQIDLNENNTTVTKKNESGLSKLLRQTPKGNIEHSPIQSNQIPPVPQLQGTATGSPLTSPASSPARSQRWQRWTPKHMGSPAQNPFNEPEPITRATSTPRAIPGSAGYVKKHHAKQRNFGTFQVVQPDFEARDLKGIPIPQKKHTQKSHQKSQSLPIRSSNLVAAMDNNGNYTLRHQQSVTSEIKQKDQDETTNDPTPSKTVLGLLNTPTIETSVSVEETDIEPANASVSEGINATSTEILPVEKEIKETQEPETRITRRNTMPNPLQPGNPFGVQRPRLGSNFVPLPSGAVFYSPPSIGDFNSGHSSGTTPPNRQAGSISPVPLFATSTSSLTLGHTILRQPSPKGTATALVASSGFHPNPMHSPVDVSSSMRVASSINSLASSPLWRPNTGVGGNSLGASSFGKTAQRPNYIRNRRPSSSSSFSVSPFKEPNSNSALLAATYSERGNFEFSPQQNTVNFEEATSAPVSKFKLSNTSHGRRREIDRYVRMVATSHQKTLPWAVDASDMNTSFWSDGGEEEEESNLLFGEAEEYESQRSMQKCTLQRRCEHPPTLDMFSSDNVSSGLRVEDMEKQLDNLMFSNAI